eukprot:Skav202338  [mRNA]  locus=scaffold781:246485:249680:+ [translate_table: standard]
MAQLLHPKSEIWGMASRSRFGTEEARRSKKEFARVTTLPSMDAKTDLSLMYDCLEWDQAFMMLGSMVMSIHIDMEVTTLQVSSNNDEAAENLNDADPPLPYAMLRKEDLPNMPMRPTQTSKVIVPWQSFAAKKSLWTALISAWTDRPATILLKKHWVITGDLMSTGLSEKVTVAN